MTVLQTLTQSRTQVLDVFFVHREIGMSRHTKL